jgi:hypothetical protein
LTFAIFFLTGSCNRADLNESKSEIHLLTDSTAFISSSAATMLNDSTHKFIKTADLKFRVKCNPIHLPLWPGDRRQQMLKKRLDKNYTEDDMD